MQRCLGRLFVLKPCRKSVVKHVKLKCKYLKITAVCFNSCSLLFWPQMKDLHLHKFCKFSVSLKFLPVCCQYLKVELALVFCFGCSYCFVILTSVSVLLFWKYGNCGTWVGGCFCNFWLQFVPLLCWVFVWLGLTGELSHLLRNQTNRKEWSCTFLSVCQYVLFESIW